MEGKTALRFVPDFDATSEINWSFSELSRRSRECASALASLGRMERAGKKLQYRRQLIYADILITVKMKKYLFNSVSFHFMPVQK